MIIIVVGVMMKKKDIKTVFITGGSSGIGLELSKQYASKGADVIIFARGKARLELAIREISSKRIHDNQEFDYRILDVSKPDEVAAVMEEAVTASGTPDILINCAGRAFPHLFENVTHDQLHQTISTNFLSMWYVAKSLIPFMKKSGGKIVNVSSMCGVMGVFGYTDYCASKFAVIGFSEALRSEVKRFNISISVVCPPDTDTPGFKMESETKPQETIALSRGAKLMQPQDVAAAIIKGVDKGKKLIVPGFDGKMIVLLKRLFPSLIERVMDRTINKTKSDNTF